MGGKAFPVVPSVQQWLSEAIFHKILAKDWLKGISKINPNTHLNSRPLLKPILVYPGMSFTCLDLRGQFHSNKTEIKHLNKGKSPLLRRFFRGVAIYFGTSLSEQINYSMSSGFGWQIISKMNTSPVRGGESGQWMDREPACGPYANETACSQACLFLPLSHPLQRAVQLSALPHCLSHASQRTPPRWPGLSFSFCLPWSLYLPTVQEAGTLDISRHYFAIRHLMLLI